MDWLSTYKIFQDWQKTFRENTEIMFSREWIQPHHVYFSSNVCVLCNSKRLQWLWWDKGILKSPCSVPWWFFGFDGLTCMYLFLHIHLRISMQPLVLYIELTSVLNKTYWIFTPLQVKFWFFFIFEKGRLWFSFKITFLFMCVPMN